MVRANPGAPPREHNCGNDGGDIDRLHKREERVVSNQAVAQEQGAGNKPDQPRCDADAPGALFNIEMAYLRDISDYHKRCPSPT